MASSNAVEGIDSPEDNASNSDPQVRFLAQLVRPASLFCDRRLCAIRLEWMPNWPWLWHEELASFPTKVDSQKVCGVCNGDPCGLPASLIMNWFL